MTLAADPLAADPVGRRVMFVLELADPWTGALAGHLMTARAEGLGGPVLTSAGQLAWLDVDPPERRSIRVSAVSRDGQFTGFEEVLDVPARAPTMPVPVVRRDLQATGLYRPPPGTLAVAGMLIDDKEQRRPIAAADVLMVLTATDGSEIRGARSATSDARGGFVAAAGASATASPQPAPPPAADGRFTGWLEVTIGATRKKSKSLAFRQARLNRIDEPLVWAELANAP